MIFKDGGFGASVAIQDSEAVQCNPKIGTGTVRPCTYIHNLQGAAAVGIRDPSRWTGLSLNMGGSGDL